MIEIEELLEALKKLKPGKASGYDGIRPDMFKYMEEDGLAVLSKDWKMKKIPEDWKLALDLKKAFHTLPKQRNLVFTEEDVELLNAIKSLCHETYR